MMKNSRIVAIDPCTGHTFVEDHSTGIVWSVPKFGNSSPTNQGNLETFLRKFHNGFYAPRITLSHVGM